MDIESTLFILFEINEDTTVLFVRFTVISFVRIVLLDESRITKSVMI